MFQVCINRAVEIKPFMQQPAQTNKPAADKAYNSATSAGAATQWDCSLVTNRFKAALTRIFSHARTIALQKVSSCEQMPSTPSPAARAKHRPDVTGRL
jgi:hypothetical protein